MRTGTGKVNSRDIHCCYLPSPGDSVVKKTSRTEPRPGEVSQKMWLWRKKGPGHRRPALLSILKSSDFIQMALEADKHFKQRNVLENDHSGQLQHGVK